MCSYSVVAFRHSMLLLSASAVMASAVQSQQLKTKPFDLSNAKLSDTTTLEPGRYQFKIISLVRAYEYVVSVSTGRETIPAIPVKPFPMGVDTLCSTLKLAIKGLEDAENEAEIPKLKKTADDLLEKPNTKCREAATKLKGLVDTTAKLLPDTYYLTSGEYVIVDVARIENGVATKRWQRRYTTGAPGAWRATYGYGFPFFQRISKGKLVSEGRQLQTRQIGDTSLYLVASQGRTRDFDAMPTVMFTFVPANEGRLHVGWTAGLGTDFNKAQVLTGLSFTIYSNLQIAAGAAFREEKVPTGLHAIGDTVKMNLTEAQLQVDAFRVRPFLSISLRFDRNPFKKDGDEPAEETKPETKPDPRKAPTPTDTTKNKTLSNSSSTR